MNNSSQLKQIMFAIASAQLERIGQDSPLYGCMDTYTCQWLADYVFEEFRNADRLRKLCIIIEQYLEQPDFLHKRDTLKNELIHNQFALTEIWKIVNNEFRAENEWILRNLLWEALEQCHNLLNTTLSTYKEPKFEAFWALYSHRLITINNDETRNRWRVKLFVHPCGTLHSDDYFAPRKVVSWLNQAGYEYSCV